MINQEHEAKFSSKRRKKKKGCAAQHQHFRFSETRRSRFSTPEYMGNTRARVYVFAAKVSIKLSPGIKQLSGGELAIIAQRAGGRLEN